MKKVKQTRGNKKFKAKQKSCGEVKNATTNKANVTCVSKCRKVHACLKNLSFDEERRGTRRTH